MKVKQYRLDSDGKWSRPLPEQPQEQTSLVLVFASGVARNNNHLVAISEAFPNAEICGATSAGEILEKEALQETLVITAIDFESSKAIVQYQKIESAEKSLEATNKALDDLPKEGLRHILYFADGLSVNHADVVSECEQHVPAGVKITGGFAGSLSRDFCAVASKTGWIQSTVAIVGIYGENLKIATGCGGRGVPFGPERVITRAEGNLLYELDESPAVDILRKYLGLEKGTDLSVDGNHFHFVVRPDHSTPGVVRGFVGYNDDEGWLQMGGDVKTGDFAQLSKTTTSILIDTAEDAAEICLKNFESQPELALIISCVSRGLSLGVRADEEIEAMTEPLPQNTPVTGFYAYGELAPLEEEACSLHNETINLTVFSE